MDEKFLQQLFAELIESNGQAIGLLSGAIAKQLDADKLSTDLAEAIKNAKSQPGLAGAAEKIAAHALKAAQTAAKIQSRSAKH